MLSWCIALFLLASFTVTQLRVKDRVDSTSHAVMNILLVAFYVLAFTSMVYNAYIVTASDPTDPTIDLERLVM